MLDEIALDIIDGKKTSLDSIKTILLGGSTFSQHINFYDFFDTIIKEKLKLGKITTADIHLVAKKNLMIYKSNLFFSEIDYNFLNSFKEWKLASGNKKNTVHTYLRKIKYVYNEAVRRGIVKDKKPFKDVFKGISIKANRNKKKYLSLQNMAKIEQIDNLRMSHQRSLDLFLLMFYLGGQSLKDIYFIKNKDVHRGRVYFKRSKLDDVGYEFDLKIFSKSKKIIDKYATDGEYLFGKWRKDDLGYKNFRSNFRRSLQKVQKEYQIEVLPKGGNISVTTARHTFATRAKFLFIETDLIRELMGHERSDVDTIYKDRYPQKIRDEAHLKIVSL